jgi:hypothetical protein
VSLNIFVVYFLTKNQREMLSTNDVARVYDTILSIPGMNDTVRIDVKISRKNILLLNSVIERGLPVMDEDKTNLLNSVPREELEELTSFGKNCLQKAELTDLHEKLKTLNHK